VSAAGTPDAQRLRSIAARVDALSAVIQQLLALLARERDALHARRDAAALEQLADEKHAAIEHAGAVYELLRGELALLFGTEQPIADSVQTLRTDHPALGAQVERLVELTRTCKQANQDNGVLVSAGLRNARRAMDSLHGARPASTYGPAGQAGAPQHGNRLAVTA
jgi:flagellar biosynthesis/type III secretory pathway chaperone